MTDETRNFVNSNVITNMKKRNKIVLLVGLLSVPVVFGVYEYQYEGEFAVEFGEPQEARDAFIVLLKEHNVSHQVRTDH